MSVHERFKDYNKSICWQRHIREENSSKDLDEAGLTPEEASKLSVPDFEFRYIDKDDKLGCAHIKKFIERHEWLGKLPNRPTHRFAAFYKDKMAGAIVMAVPNTFSNILGKDYKNQEKLISRGACISWSPKNVGSWLIMSSIRWMVHNTNFRFYTAYSDPEAKELGTIYQACNFIYLGQDSGTNKSYFDPEHPEYGWFSSRNFRHKSKYRRYAREAGIDWDSSWMGKYTPKWDQMPVEIVKALKDGAKRYEKKCECRESPAKHKYCYILGKSKSETSRLKKLFCELNPDKCNLPYPVERGK